MTSDEIKATTSNIIRICDADNEDTAASVEAAGWLKEIAYQLACHNEREDYRLMLLEDDLDSELPPDGTGGAIGGN
jgi:hypothetical protein